MCGILVSHAVGGAFHHGQLDTLKPRGPDAIGFWTDGTTHLGHTRLSILGLDARGNQPMQNDTHVVVYNGEIYNFHEIREKLAALGIRMRGASDTEVLLHAWTQWGPAVLSELVGFWAFAIHDKRARKLTLVRDQMGIKPLYYWSDGGKFCAASLIRTILEVMGETGDLDYQALSEYVRYQFTFGDKTFIKQVRKVLPGHMVEVDLDTGRIQDTCYEDILAPKDHSSEDFSAELVRRTQDLLEQCCQDSTISDTSFTTFCSGGLDSSLITNITKPEVAYHANYSDSECNETFFAKEAVAQTRTRLMVVNANENFNLVEKLQDIVDDFDELTIGSVILPLDDLLSQVKRRYKVILTGTGGDELFAGYVRYQLAKGECLQDSYRGLYERMRGVESLPRRFEMTHCKGNPSAYAFYDRSTEDTFHEAFAACRNGGGDLHQMLTFDRRYFLGGLLNIDDKMCGRHSLESRPSFLHQQLVRHVLRIKPEALLTNGELKHFLRSMAVRHLPRSVTHRTDKMGFTTPIGTFVNKSAHQIREQISTSRFRHLYNLKGMHFTAETKFSREVFGLLMLDLWLNRYARH